MLYEVLLYMCVKYLCDSIIMMLALFLLFICAFSAPLNTVSSNSLIALRFVHLFPKHRAMEKNPKEAHRLHFRSIRWWWRRRSIQTVNCWCNTWIKIPAKQKKRKIEEVIVTMFPRISGALLCWMKCGCRKNWGDGSPE